MRAVGLFVLILPLALTIAAVVMLVVGYIADVIGYWRRWRREQWQQQRERLPDNQLVRLDQRAEVVSLDTLRGQLAMKTDERAVFTREGGFTLKPKKRKKHGRKWKHR